MLLAQYVMGVGGEETQQFLSLMNLLHGKNFSKNTLSRVEADVGVAFAGPEPLTSEKWLEMPEKERPK
eukprot:12076640-Ditylum_brightwellii.AAC.1